MSKLIDIVQRLKLVNDYHQCKHAMNDAITEIQQLRKQVADLEVENTMLIGEAEELKALKIAHLVGNPLKEIEALSLQVAQLREALEEVINENVSNRKNASKRTLFNITKEMLAREALKTPPSQDEWIKRSNLERVAIVPDHTGGFDQLFKIKGE